MFTVSVAVFVPAESEEFFQKRNRKFRTFPYDDFHKPLRKDQVSLTVYAVSRHLFHSSAACYQKSDAFHLNGRVFADHFIAERVGS